LLYLWQADWFWQVAVRDAKGQAPARLKAIKDLSVQTRHVRLTKHSWKARMASVTAREPQLAQLRLLM